jgi:serine/threonine protein kinase
MTFKERYQYNPVTDLLGKGGFARVYKAHDTNLDIDVAVKIFNATEANAGKYTVYEEIKRGIKLNHPNVLRYFDAAILEHTNSLGEQEVIQIGIMELANAGDLKQFSRLYPGSPVLVQLLKEVLSGLDYLHQRGLIHRDLKPQNILLSEQDGIVVAKISDFGISKAMDGGGISSSKAIGTIEYMAPEQFNPQKYGMNGEIRTNMDLWSFGVMLYELIAGDSLFGQRGGNTSAEQIMSTILMPGVPDKVEGLQEPFRSVVKRCLVHNAADRVQRASELIPMLDGAVVEQVSMPSAKPEEDTEQTRMFSIPKAPAAESAPAPKPEAKPKPVAAPTPKPAADPLPPFVPPPRKKKPVGLILGVVVVVIAAFVSLPYLQNSSEPTPAELVQDAGRQFAAGETDSVVMTLEKAIPGITETDTSLQRSAHSLMAKVMLKITDTSGALPHLEKAVLFQDENSLFEMGWISYQGRFQKKDLKKAVDYFTMAASKKNVQAEVQLGNMYFMGDGVKADYNEAVRHYFSAASMGNSIAMYALGLAYLEGAGVAQDREAAIKWFKKAVEKNDNPDVVKAAKAQLGLPEETNTVEATAN